MFHLTHITWKCCLIGRSLVFAWQLEVIETALPFSLCKSKIHFLRQWSCYVTFINYVINLTVPFHWTFFFFFSISFWSLVSWFQCDFFIMSLDDFRHIGHATVADFNCNAVENTKINYTYCSLFLHRPLLQYIASGNYIL